MKKLWIIPFLLIGMLLLLTNSCKKDKDASPSKKNPVIVWANPMDITSKTLLGNTQLNATSDVPGTFVYIPAAGTKLDEGNNQVLKTTFTPTDTVTYNTISKTATINVIPNTIIDIDNNVYKVVVIDTMVWMAENLKTTKFNDNTAIPKVVLGADWADLTTPAYCWYDNAPANKAIYGALYNWYTVSNSNLCPTGWHVPTDTEWATLITYLGGESEAGYKIKETGVTHWKAPNANATNESGFTAVPGGIRSSIVGDFIYISINGIYWSNTSSSKANAFNQIFVWSNGECVRGTYAKKTGLSVRCMRD